MKSELAKKEKAINTGNKKMEEMKNV